MFQTSKFLKDQFGNPDAIAGIAAVYDVDVPSTDTMRKWFSRGSVSGEWWPILMMLLEKYHGSPVSLEQYGGGSYGSSDIFG